MSDQRRADQQKPKDAAGSNPDSDQRRADTSRRRGGRRSRPSSGEPRQSGEGSQQASNRPQKDGRTQDRRRQPGDQKQDSAAQTGQNEAGRPPKQGSRRRAYRSRRPRGERGDSSKQPAAQTGDQNQTQPPSRPTSETAPEARQPGEARTQSSRGRRRGRRGGPSERSQPDNQAVRASQSSQRKKRPARDDQDRTSRPADSQPPQRPASSGRTRRSSRRSGIRRSPGRVFNPGRDSEISQTDSPSGQRTYVSFLNQFSPRPAPSIPIRTDRGIKARSQRGSFSQNWWARRWIESMEQLVDPARLQRGRSYARSGQVLSLNETSGGIEAKVQGSRPAPYKATIQVTPLTAEQWSLVIDALAEQAIFTAQLLAGEMPANIEDAFQTAGVSLFPDRPGDLFTSCSCPDWANPCKHVAATHYILGDRFDDDPFLLFRMRGRSQEQILADLNLRRGGPIETEQDEPQEEAAGEPAQASPQELLEHFWEPVESLDSFPLTIQPPRIDMPLLTRLGEPAFLPGLSLLNILRPVYQAFTYAALRAAYSEEEPVESNPPEESPDKEEQPNGSSDPQNSSPQG